jgi:hypothetical protein
MAIVNDRPGLVVRLRRGGPRFVRGRFDETVLACLVLAAALCAIHHEIVFGGRTFLPMGTVAGVMGPAVPWRFTGEFPFDAYRVDRGASAWVVHPQAKEVAKAYREGRLPLWNPHQGLGAPLAANAQSGAFDLMRLPVFVSSDPVVWDLYYLLCAYGGLVLTYLFARSIGLSFAAGIFAAVAYGFSGFLVVFGNTHFVEVYLLFPGLLWATEMLRSGRRRRGLVAIAAVVAATILAGMPEASLMTLLCGSAYGAYRMAWDAIDRRTWRAALAPNHRLLVFGWVIGLGLAAPLILPLAEYIGQSFHVHGPERQMGLRADLPYRMVLVAIPLLHGTPLGSIDPGGSGIAWAGYSGAVVVVLAVAGAFALRRGPMGRSGAFFVGALILLWSKFFGVPVVNELGRLPGLNLMIIPKWGSPLVSFSLAMLGAVAVHAACAGRGLRPRSVGAAVLVLAGYAAIMVRLNEPLLPLFSRAHLLATVVPAAAAAALICALLLLRRLPAPARGAVLCLAVFAELFVLAPHGIFPTRYDPLVKPPFVRYLLDRQQREGPFRMFATGGLLYPNFATAFHIDDIRMLDALYPDRYFEYVQAFLADNVVDRYTGGYGSTEKPTRIAWNKWLDAANVRFVIVPPGQNPGGGQTERPEPGPRQFDPVYRREVDIYENRRALPRAFVVGATVVVRNRQEARIVMSEPAFDPSVSVVLEASDASGRTTLSASAPSRAGEARVSRYEAQEVEVLVEAERPGVLVLTDVYYPGWEAELDGKPVPIHPADLAFRGVVVSAGPHRVVFRYRPASVTAALGLAGLSVVALAAALRSRTWTGPAAPGPAVAPMGAA